MSKDKEYGKFKLVGFFLGPILFCASSLIPATDGGLTSDGIKVIAVASLMISWWVTEAVPVPVTSLIPIALLPVMGVFTINEATESYSSPAVYLYMGGFLIAIAIQKWNLHKRIALTVVKYMGTNVDRLFIGYLFVTSFLSVWMSNTATTVMMMPIGLSIIALFSCEVGGSEGKSKALCYNNFAASMMIGTAYAANIGGVATLVGTPTNGMYGAFMKGSYGYDVSFLEWLLIASPIVVIMMVATWFVLAKLVFPVKTLSVDGMDEMLSKELRELGPMGKEEKLVGAVFLTAAILWIFRSPIDKLITFTKISDESIAIFSSIALFLIPTNFKKGKFLMDWESAKNLPWGILLLFGGGLTLAKAFADSGVVSLIGAQMQALHGIGAVGLVGITASLGSIMTTFMSNMALAGMTLPVVSSAAIGLDLSPFVAAAPMAISASFAFMLPMSTPPNAIVFASGKFSIIDMIKAGFLVNLIGIFVLTLLTVPLVEFATGLVLDVVPVWAK